MTQGPVQNDHRRIGRRLSGDIFMMQLVGFVVLDMALYFLIWLGSRTGARFAPDIPWLDVTSHWVLVPIVAIEVLCLIVTTSYLRRSVREQVEPLREVRVARDDISQKYAKLETAYAAQSKFVSDASHELRTPIAVIQGYANLLSRWGADDPDTLRESIDAIRSESESMKRLVNQLLFLARGDNDTLQVDLQKVDLAAVLAEVLREQEMIDTRHTLLPQLPENPVWAKVDAGLIKQLVRILVDNAMKYTEEGGAIRISLAADQEAGEARIFVSDEGQGIPASVLPHVFDRFVRADEARTRNTGGSGLGLSIAKQIADRHGGRIEVISREGIGTRFLVVLPLG
ncbi:MAG: cell wall metabolism sensor histidine kinase WalK [Clostridiales Family XIII bacterium]|jgi:signal transduction histidine kinase|nr:cell wall metabolism sensor histidine kinase WalK [Clostridiales Family XIII bacterium]